MLTHRSQKSVLEVCDKKALELLRNPSYSFIASKESDKAPRVYQSTSCRIPIGIECVFVFSATENEISKFKGNQHLHT